MDAIQQISNESFSYGWLNNIKPSFDRLGDSLRRSFDALESIFFIEMDPDFFSMRWTDSRGFDFNLPSCDSSALIHADQIFSNGRLLPLHLANPLRSKEASVSSDSVLTRSVSLDSSKRLLSQSNRWDNSNSTDSSPTLSSGANKLGLGLPLLGRSTKSPGKSLRKYFYFLIPLYKKVKGLKMISSRTTRSCGDSLRSSPRMSADRRRVNRVFDMESESSIHDAVLHCKRSIANSAVGEL